MALPMPSAVARFSPQLGCPDESAKHSWTPALPISQNENFCPTTLPSVDIGQTPVDWQGKDGSIDDRTGGQGIRRRSLRKPKIRIETLTSQAPERRWNSASNATPATEVKRNRGHSGSANGGSKCSSLWIAGSRRSTA